LFWVINDLEGEKEVSAANGAVSTHHGDAVETNPLQGTEDARHA